MFWSHMKRLAWSKAHYLTEGWTLEKNDYDIYKHNAALALFLMANEPTKAPSV